MKILFVENHSVFAKQVSTNFLSDCLVTIVPSLAAAHASLNAGNFDVVLVDYDLDDGKGVELVRKLRKSENAIPIIGVSAREEGNTALLEAGVDAICSKMEFDRIRELI